MKKIIIITVLILLIITAGMVAVFSFNSDELIFTGDVISHANANSYQITRAYVSDKDEVANVKTILERINSEEPPPNAADIALEIAEKGNIVFAPVFNLQVSTVENTTGLYMLTGSVKNGVDVDGNEVVGEFSMRDLSLSITSNSVNVLNVSNGFHPTVLEEITYIPPVVSEDGLTITVPFSMTNGFEVLFTVDDIENFGGMIFTYNYNAHATSSMNMTKLEQEIVEIKLDFEIEENKVVPIFTSKAIDTGLANGENQETEE